MRIAHNQPLSAVIDTGVFVSAILRRDSAPKQTVDFFLKNGEIIFTYKTLQELIAVVFRPKFDALMTLDIRNEFLTEILSVAKIISLTEHVAACRDPKDDMILSAALAGEVDVIISGDKDLQVLHPFRNIPILSPRQFLQEVIHFEKK